MDIGYEALKKRLEEFDLDGIERVFYNMRWYWVDPNTTPDEECGKPAEWFRSSAYDGADVYIWDNVKPEFKKPMILHEIIEADLRLHQWLPIEEAHDIAKELSTRHARETLDDVSFALYERERDEMEQKYGKAA